MESAILERKLMDQAFEIKGCYFEARGKTDIENIELELYILTAVTVRSTCSV
jgi:hypothetical protein